MYFWSAQIGISWKEIKKHKKNSSAANLSNLPECFPICFLESKLFFFFSKSVPQLNKPAFMLLQQPKLAPLSQPCPIVSTYCIGPRVTFSNTNHSYPLSSPAHLFCISTFHSPNCFVISVFLLKPLKLQAAGAFVDLMQEHANSQMCGFRQMCDLLLISVRAGPWSSLACGWNDM